MLRRTLFGLFSCLAIVTSSCGGSSSSSSPAPSSSGSDTALAGAEYNAQYKAIISNNCLSCHGSGADDFSSFDKVKARRADMLKEITDGEMPPASAQKSQWASADKAKLVEYLTNSADFK